MFSPHGHIHSTGSQAWEWGCHLGDSAFKGQAWGILPWRGAGHRVQTPPVLGDSPSPDLGCSRAIMPVLAGGFLNISPSPNGSSPPVHQAEGWASPSPWELGPREPHCMSVLNSPSPWLSAASPQGPRGSTVLSHSSSPPVHRTIVQGAPSCVLGSLSPGCSTTPPVHERLSSHSFRSLGGAVHCQACTSSPPVQMAIVLACQDPGVHTASPTPTPPSSI